MNPSDPLYLIDFYKVGHVSQYPDDTTQVWANWTPRYTHTKENSVVLFGMQYFIKEILNDWQRAFFSRPIEDILKEYRELVLATLGATNPRVDHIEKLHAHSYLPITIYSLPEGSSVPLRVPMFVITNNTPDTYWLPNYLETILSNILWKPCTSATTASAYRRLFVKYAKEYGHTDMSFVDWQGHDFSFRGMSGREDAILSGMGHLLSFSGTDTIPAILAAHKYYNAALSCGGSVAATEHSVMCAGGEDSELETFRRLLTEVYPTGIVSVVSDTWNLWDVLTKILPDLKDTILARDGKLVIRPDSGDPVNILCGDKGVAGTSPRCKGVFRLLQEVFGIVDGMIPKVGAIYGDAINLDRAESILSRMVREIGISPFNVVLGIGSFTYEYVTRDTHGFAMKATAVTRSGKILDIFKKPVTDCGTKNSLKGIPAVYRTEESTDENPSFFVTDGNKPEALDNCAFQKVYSNGKLLIEEDFETIRKRVRASC